MAEDSNLGYQYRLLDPNTQEVLANFQELTGGEMELGLVSYTQVFDTGLSNTWFIPGQVSYTPVTMLRPVDRKSFIFFKEFQTAVLGMRTKVKRNFTVEMMNAQGDAVLVRWHLNNSVPMKITGFSFNDYAEAYYTTVELTVQPEEILVEFVGTEKQVEEAIPE